MDQKTPVKKAGNQRRISLTVAAAAGLVSLGLVGCSGAHPNAIVSALPPDYRVNHPITLTESLATFDIPVGTETRYLAVGMEGNVMGFASSFLQSGSSAIAIVLPIGSANSANAAAMAAQIEGILVSSGIPLGAIEYRSYQAGAQENLAPVRLAFVRIAATTAPCGNWPENVARNRDNTNFFNYGCASQQNLAAMIANPLDLLYPRMMTPPNAARRSTVLQDYQAGQPTNTNFDAAGGVAEAAQ